MRNAVLIAVASVFIAVPVLADPYGTVNVQYRGIYDAPTLWQTTTVYDSTHMASPVGGVVTGIYRLQLSNYSDNAGNPDNLRADQIAMLNGKVDSFCIDILDNTGTGRYEVDPLAGTPEAPAGPMDTAKAIDLAELLHVNWTDNLTAPKAAAIEAAVWEIVNEDTAPYNVSTGNLTIYNNAAVVSAANDMLSHLTPDLQQVDYRGEFVGLSNSTYQDFVVKTPLPGAVLLGFLGLGAAGLKLRRFA